MAPQTRDNAEVHTVRWLVACVLAATCTGCTGGLTVYAGEWWHFDGPGPSVDRPFLDVPLN